VRLRVRDPVVVEVVRERIDGIGDCVAIAVGGDRRVRGGDGRGPGRDDGSGEGGPAEPNVEREGGRARDGPEAADVDRRSAVQAAVVPTAIVSAGNVNVTVRPMGVLWARGLPVASTSWREAMSERGAVPRMSIVRLPIAAGPPTAVRSTWRRGAFAPESTTGA